ncbi:laccase-24-like [Canna indica]|uniref:Laccase n=1 Tax=Canna indica TaxID=4628 RepID=A0AAQ3KTP0_9LILI|nr:laccase-24-like [Canna indica]
MDMASTLALALAFLSFFAAEAKIVEHTFHVGNLTQRRLCEEKVITAVNGQFPGPTIEVNEGDTLVVNVINESPYNMTIHWHGIFQLRSAWADGPNMITQCPIRPGNSYVYKFNVTGQEGTLWWHSHVSVLRATVYGALIIRPRGGLKDCPFPEPDHEVPILLGEWWKADVVELDNQAFLRGQGFNSSDAYTINGQPGDLYNCSRKHTYKLKVVSGKTYLLRIINAALNNQLFFKIAGHNFTVVAVDASYTKPYKTDVVVVSPGQTVDVLMVADAAPGNYYMAASPYISVGPQGPPFVNISATGIVEYLPVDDSSAPVMPSMPPFNDTPTAHRFFTNLTGLLKPGKPTVPHRVHEKMFFTVGLGRNPCQPSQTLCNRTRQAISASMNNVSFEFPTTVSLLEAHFKGANGVYRRDFPRRPRVFDYVNATGTLPLALQTTLKGTRVRTVKYNATVEIVLQNTAFVGIENHPMHLHGFNFFVVAQGFGNYNATAAKRSFNLVDPQVRNTIGVPTGGWAVIRFVANNPGVWFMHCHLDAHLEFGLAMAFEVENGPTADTSLPPPPPDFPTC